MKLWLNPVTVAKIQVGIFFFGICCLLVGGVLLAHGHYLIGPSLMIAGVLIAISPNCGYP